VLAISVSRETESDPVSWHWFVNYNTCSTLTSIGGGGQLNLAN